MVRREFIKSVGVLVAMATMPGVFTRSFTHYMSSHRYSCVWMGIDEISREIAMTSWSTERFKHGAWVATLECTMDGMDWYCCQLFDNLKNEPRIKKAFYRAMYRRYKALRATG